MFCQSCIEGMHNYPIDINTPIQLPLRNETPGAKRRAPKKKPLSPEETLSRTRSSLRLFIFLSAFLLIAFALAAGLALYLLNAQGTLPVSIPF